eukprot:2429462-Rhodomonas_salina.4
MLCLCAVPSSPPLGVNTAAERGRVRVVLAGGSQKSSSDDGPRVVSAVPRGGHQGRGRLGRQPREVFPPLLISSLFHRHFIVISSSFHGSGANSLHLPSRIQTELMMALGLGVRTGVGVATTASA